MNRTIPQRSLVALALVLVLVLGSVPAYGASAIAVVTGRFRATRSSRGATSSAFRRRCRAAAIASASVVPTLAPLTVNGDGHTHEVLVRRAPCTVNVDAMLGQAYAATDTVTPFDLAPTTRSSRPWSRLGRDARQARSTIRPTNAKREVKEPQLWSSRRRRWAQVYTANHDQPAHQGRPPHPRSLRRARSRHS